MYLFVVVEIISVRRWHAAFHIYYVTKAWCGVYNTLDRVYHYPRIYECYSPGGQNRCCYRQ